MIYLNVDDNEYDDDDDDDDYMHKDDEAKTNVPISPKKLESGGCSSPIGTRQYLMDTEIWKDFSVDDIS